MSGGAKSIKVICELATMLQRNEDTDRNDFDYGGTSTYLKVGECPYVDAVLMRPGYTSKAHFIDQSHHRLGTYGSEDCPFYGRTKFITSARDFPFGCDMSSSGEVTRPQLTEADGLQLIPRGPFLVQRPLRAHEAPPLPSQGTWKQTHLG